MMLNVGAVVSSEACLQRWIDCHTHDWAQEFMIAMECFFFEWYPDNDKEGPYGRTFVSNNTQAVETSMKEGGVRSLLS